MIFLTSDDLLKHFNTSVVFNKSNDSKLCEKLLCKGYVQKFCPGILSNFLSQYNSKSFSNTNQINCKLPTVTDFLVDLKVMRK